MSDQLSEARMFCLLSDLDKEEPPPPNKKQKTRAVSSPSSNEAWIIFDQSHFHECVPA